MAAAPSPMTGGIGGVLRVPFTDRGAPDGDGMDDLKILRSDDDGREGKRRVRISFRGAKTETGMLHYKACPIAEGNRKNVQGTCSKIAKKGLIGNPPNRFTRNIWSMYLEGRGRTITFRRAPD